MKGKILIVYSHDFGYPTKITNDDMLYSFKKYSDHLCYYVNASWGIPHYLKDVKFDVIIFHDLLLSKRSLAKIYSGLVKKCEILKSFSGYRIATIQDEYIQIKLLNKFINEFDIKYLFVASKASEWKKIYPDIDRKKVKIKTVLTGYIDNITLKKIKLLEKKIKDRPIDIGYRAASARFSLGYHNYLKEEISKVFKNANIKEKIKIDVSNNIKDTIYGMDWYIFLLKCKYILGVESGASLLDVDGSIQRKVFGYRSKYPNATYREVEKACFKGMDGNLKLFPLGPRHLEACMTKTCQILIEGDYNGILKPNKHYIELKKDFSNLDEVLQKIKDDKSRKIITEQAYKDIVESGKYTYNKFVHFVIKNSLGKNYLWNKIEKQDLIFYKKNQYRESLIWKYIPIKSFFIMNIIKYMPKNLLYRLIRSFS